jgi:hypothetical protein
MIEEVETQVSEEDSTTLAVILDKAEVAEPVSEDLISKTVANIQAMDEQTTVMQLNSINDVSAFNSFVLGGLLAQVQANGWFGSQSNFKSWVESDTDIGYRKAAYLTSIYRMLIESGVEWNQVEILGWTKLARLLPILTKENADQLVYVCKDMTVVQVAEFVKEQQKTGELVDVTEKKPNEVSVISFKAHLDQKETIAAAIEKKQQESGTSVKTVALEFICLDYLSGPSKPTATAKPAQGTSLKSVMQSNDLVEVLRTLEEVFPNIEVSVKEK